jgi:tRNA(Leu) C34 or U34 (ribose-2'-O)-methylase TrmL
VTAKPGQKQRNSEHKHSTHLTHTRFPTNIANKHQPGTQHHVTVRMFADIKSIVAFVKTQECEIIGIEIRDDAKPIASHPFKGNTAFILGNEGYGLDATHAKFCDSFVYIPHYGAGTASLNVMVAGSIVFSHFGMWAGYAERKREGEKFVVQKRKIQRGPVTEFEIRKHAARKARKLEAAAGEVTEGAGGGEADTR